MARRPVDGPLLRYDLSPLWQVHDLYFTSIGIQAWSTGAIPYSGVSNYNEAFKKARLLIANFLKSKPIGELRILEVGAGYGEFAKNFLTAFRDLCISQDVDFHSRLKYYITDYAELTLEQLQASGRLKDFESQIVFVRFDILDQQAFADLNFDAILGNYILDQLPARVFAKTADKYLEKYLAVEDLTNYFQKQSNSGFWLRRNKWIKHVKKQVEFIEIDWLGELSLSRREILDTCFKANKESTIVYSYGALRALRNFLHLLKPTGLIICSDFNASTRSGIDNYEPCYYGNSMAQPVNFEFLYKYFNFGRSNSFKQSRQDQGYQQVLIYEDPIKPLHTLILTRPDFPESLDLGLNYREVYYQNWFLRMIYRYLVELQLSVILFLIVAVICCVIAIVRNAM